MPWCNLFTLFLLFSLNLCSILNIKDNLVRFPLKLSSLFLPSKLCQHDFVLCGRNSTINFFAQQFSIPKFHGSNNFSKNLDKS